MAECPHVNRMKIYNGKDLEAALNEFQKFMDYTKKKQDYSYYGIEDYLERMKAVFGVDGYRVFYSDLSQATLPTGQVILYCKCHIDILDENGGIAYFAEGYGSYEMSLAKSGDRFNHLNNVGIEVNVSAFKAACKEMNIFACRDVEVVRAREKGRKPYEQSGNKQGSSGQKNNSKQSAPQPIVVMEFYIQRPLELMRRDREGKPAYRMRAHEIKDERMNSSESEILFYPNQYKNAVDKLNKLIARSEESQKGFRIKLGVTSVLSERQNTEFAGSFVFKGFEEGL